MSLVLLVFQLILTHLTHISYADYAGMILMLLPVGIALSIIPQYGKTNNLSCINAELFLQRITFCEFSKSLKNSCLNIKIFLKKKFMKVGVMFYTRFNLIIQWCQPLLHIVT